MALINKRLIHTLRNKVLTITQLLIPISVILLNLVYLKYAPVKPEDSPMLEMNISKYDKNYIPYLRTSTVSSLGGFYENQFRSNEDNTQVYDLNERALFQKCSNSRSSIDDYLSCIGLVNFNYLDSNSVLAATMTGANTNSSRLAMIGHFNNQPYHAPPLALNSLTNTLFKLYTNRNESQITVINHPLPRNLSEIINDFNLSDPTSFNVASGLTFGMGFLLASFVIFLIKEKTTNSRHLQYLSGCSSLLYWSSAFLWDFVSFLIPTIVVLLLLWVTIYFQ